MEIVSLDGRMFAQMIRCGSENLRRNRTIVNELNVFPIPDGDTGDNMYMTVQAGCDALGSNDIEIGTAAFDAAHGMLLGARGNSGVILSRIFAGIADGFAGESVSDAGKFCAALSKGVEKAYKSVSVPVEGTMLTVFREACEYVSRNADKYRDIYELFTDLLSEARKSLERTPELLAVLRESGVVDSGGAGLYYIIEGMIEALRGVDSAATGSNGAVSGSEDEANGDDIAVSERLDGTEGVTFGYCTEFLLQLMPGRTEIASFDTDALSKKLAEMGGDSIVAFREDDIVKVHVHTRTPGSILDYCQGFGEYLKLKIENMTLQHKNTVIRNRFSESGGVVLHTAAPKKKVGVVTVAAGDGVKKLFTDAGADYVIDGGQSMNPSTAAFIEAFNAVNAQTIIVMPNNKNVIMAANQAAEIYTDSHITVLPTHTVGEGYSALTMMDTSFENTDDIVASMKEACESVVTAMVSRAVRESNVGGVHVSKGDYIGFVDDDILSCAATRNEAAAELARKLNAGSRDVVIILAGADTPVEESDSLYSQLNDGHPSAEMFVMDGGQPVYDYILIIE